MYESKVNKSYIMAFLSVVFVSIIFNLCIRKNINFEYLSIGIDDMYAIIHRSNRDVISYVIFKRLKQLLIILILIKAFGCGTIYNTLLVSLSGILGLLLSVQVYYLGIQGVIVLLLYLLPHYIFYCVSFYYCKRTKLFESKTDENIKNLICIIIIYVAGMVVEGVFMTNFLKFFYQHMVM